MCGLGNDVAALLYRLTEMAVCYVQTRKTSTKKRKASVHLMRPLPLGPALVQFTGKKEMPRSQITKAVWAYAKQNDLQQGSTIINGGDLKPLFGTKKVIKFGEIASMIKKHTL